MERSNRIDEIRIGVKKYASLESFHGIYDFVIRIKFVPWWPHIYKGVSHSIKLSIRCIKKGDYVIFTHKYLGI